MLTSNQLQTLKTAVLSDPAAAAYRTAGDSYGLKLWLDGASATSVWRTDAPVAAIIDAINWANYTPNDAADSTVIYTNRALLAQTKQMNLQLMLQGRQTLDASKANLRAGLRDAVIQVPTGTAGAMTSPGGAGGATVLNVCVRTATRAEAALAGAPTQTGTVAASALTFEGPVDSDSVTWLINN